MSTNTPSMNFRPGPEAERLEALALILDTSRNEVLRQGLRLLSEAVGENNVREMMATIAKLKRKETT